MNHRLIIQALAEDDITQAALWYEGQHAGLGEEFIAEVDAALQSAVANPRQYSSLRRKPDVRRVITHCFPYRIFFVLHHDSIVVFRVLHGARHDNEWQGRVPQS